MTDNKIFTVFLHSSAGAMSFLRLGEGECMEDALLKMNEFRHPQAQIYKLFEDSEYKKPMNLKIPIGRDRSFWFYVT